MAAKKTVKKTALKTGSKPGKGNKNTTTVVKAASKGTAKPSTKKQAAPKKPQAAKKAAVKKTAAPVKAASKKSAPAKKAPSVQAVIPKKAPIVRKPTSNSGAQKKQAKQHVEKTPPAPAYSTVLSDEVVTPSKSLRYSDEALEEFKIAIELKLSVAQRHLETLQSYVRDPEMRTEREQNASMASRQVEFINNLQKALVRIENKSYGICTVTGKLIERARLIAVPHATLSIEAKNKQPEKIRRPYTHPSHTHVKTYMSA